MSKLPQLPASLLAGTSGITPQQEAPKVRPPLGMPGNKQTEMGRKMQSLRMQQTMQTLHFIACDPGEAEEDRVNAAHELAMLMNRHFDTLIWALRVAGGAARP